MERLYRAHVYQPIDLGVMRQTLAMFVGKHDFANYGNRVERARSLAMAKGDEELKTVRNV